MILPFLSIYTVNNKFCMNVIIRHSLVKPILLSGNSQRKKINCGGANCSETIDNIILRPVLAILQQNSNTTLLSIHNDLILSMDRGKVTSLILLDLSAAFDTVVDRLVWSS